MKKIVLLGSTGSIGTQAFEIIKRQGFVLEAVAAGSNITLLEEQIREFKPKKVCVYDADACGRLKKNLAGFPVEIEQGLDGLCKLASIPGCVVLNAVVGMVGLKPTLCAIEAGNDVALANKETLVAGGELVMKKAREKGVRIIPVDSEHSAVFQCIQADGSKFLKKIILTASGGPFFGKDREFLQDVTVSQALVHPNWTMGRKITIDSATLMNKGLELIEACHLFEKTPDEIEIVVHRQSIIHSLVEFTDNAVLAQLGLPDMKIPIQYALTYPERLSCSVAPLSLTEIGELTFEKPDTETFLCLKACMEAAKRGGLTPAIVNGAGEQAVELFLNEEISFTDIGDIVYRALDLHTIQEDYTYEDVVAADRKARDFVLSRYKKA